MADSTIPLDVTGSPDLYLASSTYTHDGETAHAEHTVVVEVDGTPVEFASETKLEAVRALLEALPTTAPQTDSLTDTQLRASAVTVVLSPTVTDIETRLDYDVRTDGNPVYVGKADHGTVTSAASWTVQKLSYDGSDRLVSQEQLTGQVWDDRATLGWN